MGGAAGVLEVRAGGNGCPQAGSDVGLAGEIHRDPALKENGRTPRGEGHALRLRGVRRTGNLPAVERDFEEVDSRVSPGEFGAEK